MDRLATAGRVTNLVAKSSWSLSALRFPVIAALAILLGGCGRGYVVNKGKNEVVWETWDEGRGTVRTTVENADAATFKTLKLQGLQGFARDKSRAYLQGVVIGGADPDTFRELTADYYRDANRVFLYTGGGVHMLPESDPDSFKIITTGWSRDRSRAYLYEKGFVPRDIGSLEPLIRIWARDSKAYYWGTREVVGADRQTFHISEQQPWFADDLNHLYWQGRVVEGCDPKTFHIQTMTSGYDDRFNYSFQQGDQADPSSSKMTIRKTPR